MARLYVTVDQVCVAGWSVGTLSQVFEEHPHKHCPDRETNLLARGCVGGTQVTAPKTAESFLPEVGVAQRILTMPDAFVIVSKRLDWRFFSHSKRVSDKNGGTSE